MKIWQEKMEIFLISGLLFHINQLKFILINFFKKYILLLLYLYRNVHIFMNIFGVAGHRNWGTFVPQ